MNHFVCTSAYQDMLDAIELGTKELKIPYNSPSHGTLNDELNTGTSSRLEPKGKEKFGEWSNVNDPMPITQTTSVGVQNKVDTIYGGRMPDGHGGTYNFKIKRNKGIPIDTIVGM